VIADGTLYFAASIWPFMACSSTPSNPNRPSVVDERRRWFHLHETTAFDGRFRQRRSAGTAGGRSGLPHYPRRPIHSRVFDRKTGKLLPPPLAENGKLGGGSEVTPSRHLF